MGSFWGDIPGVSLKSAVAAVVLFLLARLMGKKQISQLSFFDYVVGISIGSVAADMSFDKNTTLFEGLSCMIVWAVFPIVFSFISLHSLKARRLLEGTPTVLIQNGKIIEDGLRKAKFTINDLLEELRIQQVFDLRDVDYAILETGGKLSLLKKAEKQALTAKDMNITAKTQELATVVIADGRIIPEGIRQHNLSRAVLQTKLEKQKISNIEEVLLGVIGSDGALHVDRKNADPADKQAFL